MTARIADRLLWAGVLFVTWAIQVVRYLDVAYMAVRAEHARIHGDTLSQAERECHYDETVVIRAWPVMAQESTRQLAPK